MRGMAPQQPLKEALNANSREEIGEAFFQSEYSRSNDTESFEPFFRYYEEEIKWLKIGFEPRNNLTLGIVMETHGDIATVVNVLRSSRNQTRPDIRTTLRQRFRVGEEEGLNRSIDIAARLWSMVNIKEDAFKNLRTSGNPHQWNDGSTLEQFLAGLFPPSKNQLNVRESRLSPFFTVAFMVDVCGLQVQWTNSLEDHLRLESHTKTLWIFPHKRVLAAYMSKPEVGEGESSPLPKNVLRETLRTYDVLFPSGLIGDRTQRFLESHRQPLHDVAPFHTSRTLNLLEYDHWRDRLLELYDEIFMAPPVSISQLWRDRRNPQQWWTFWIALLILLSTLVSTATSMAQTWATFKSLPK